MYSHDTAISMGVVKSDLQGEPKLIESQIIDYVIHLREELNLSSSTINNRVAAVKKFYETQKCIQQLNGRKIKSYIGKGKGARKKDKKDRAYTHDAIRIPKDAGEGRSACGLNSLFF